MPDHHFFGQTTIGIILLLKSCIHIYEKIKRDSDIWIVVI